MKKVCMMLTNPCTNDARVIKEAISLAGNGYNVRILATMGDNIPEVEQAEGFTIRRIKRSFKSNTLLGKLEFTLKFTFAALREKADIYHAHDLSTLLECYIASRLNQSKLVYDSHELYGDRSKRGLGVFLYSTLEKRLIKKADPVITVNKYISNILATTYKLNNSPVIVMNCPSLEPSRGGTNYATSITPQDIYQIKKNKRIILYQGVIQEGRGGMELIESMKYLDNEYYLLMVGDGPLKENLEGRSVKLGLDDRICFTGMVSLRHLSDYTRLADIGVILLSKKKSLNYYYASPNKLFEYIHANVPVLAPNYPFLKEIVEKYDIGMLIDAIGPKEIADKIKLILSDMGNYQRMKENTEVAKRELNWENEEKKLLEAYKML